MATGVLAQFRVSVCSNEAAFRTDGGLEVISHRKRPEFGPCQLGPKPEEAWKSLVQRSALASRASWEGPVAVLDWKPDEDICERTSAVS